MRSLILCVLAASMAPLAGAQTAGVQTIQDTNVHAWFMYFGDHPIKKGPWGIHLEGQLRRADAGFTPQQVLLRPALNYKLNDHILFTAGYAFARTSRYGDVPAKAAFPEHRVFEQVLLKHKIGKIPIQHRLRLEQRLVGIVPSDDAGVDRWETRNRFRYMLRADFPLPIRTASGKPFGLAVYDEPFFHFGGNRGIRYLDQNRAYAALTYKLTKSNRVEVGYLHQYVPQRNGIVSEHNHTLQFAWFSSTPFGNSKD